MLLFCAKTIVKESLRLELACLKKNIKKKKEEKKKNILAVWRLSGSYSPMFAYITLPR